MVEAAILIVSFVVCAFAAVLVFSAVAHVVAFILESISDLTEYLGKRLKVEWVLLGVFTFFGTVMVLAYTLSY